MLVALLLLTGVIRPDGPVVLLVLFVVAVLAALAWLIWSLVRASRRANPDQWGDLTTTDGLELVDAPGRPRDVRTVVPVDDANRHQPAIELARLYGGAEQHAVLVPRASRWMSRRYRVGVQLVGGDRPRHAGFLGRCRGGPLGRPARRPRERAATTCGSPRSSSAASRPFGVDLDLSGLEALEAPESPAGVMRRRGIRRPLGRLRPR